MKKLRLVDFSIRTVLVVCLFLVGAPFFNSDALSAEYPSRPIEFVTHSDQGGPIMLSHICLPT